MEHVILVDAQDNELGTMEKMEAHKNGILHRAFSILLFDAEGRLLLQRRSDGKYHSSGLWTNTCCSHPAPGESLEEATRRRLMEEMGIDLQPAYAFTFIYKAKLDKGLIEHELDHVFTGTFNGKPAVNPSEVQDWKYVHLDKLREDMRKNPEEYTAWFKVIVDHPEMDALPYSSSRA